ncbi:ABC transporter transmembrane region [Ceratobasidium sp. AG-Ba]|nr:ABC transporter transmembrane region [Ceratobasidium sp. AG-Ba]
MPKIVSSFKSIRPDTDKSKPLEFNHKWGEGPVFDWYRDLKDEDRPIQTIQIRRYIAKPVPHRFIVLRMRNGQDHRFDRRPSHVQDANTRPFDVMMNEAVASEDSYTCGIKLSEEELTSEREIEITLGGQVDLRTVIAICYAISQDENTKKYTFLRHNCFFFSWTILTIVCRHRLPYDVPLHESVMQRFGSNVDQLTTIVVNQAVELFLDLVIKTVLTFRDEARKSAPAAMGLMGRMGPAIPNGLIEFLWRHLVKLRLHLGLRRRLSQVVESEVMKAANIVQEATLATHVARELLDGHLWIKGTQTAIRAAIEKEIMKILWRFILEAISTDSNGAEEENVEKQLTDPKLNFTWLGRNMAEMSMVWDAVLKGGLLAVKETGQVVDGLSHKEAFDKAWDAAKAAGLASAKATIEKTKKVMRNPEREKKWEAIWGIWDQGWEKAHDRARSKAVGTVETIVEEVLATGSKVVVEDMRECRTKTIEGFIPNKERKWFKSRVQKSLDLTNADIQDRMQEIIKRNTINREALGAVHVSMESVWKAAPSTMTTSTHERKTFKGPVYFYAFTYAERTEWILYGVGLAAAIISGAGFPVLDLVYGYWTNALVSNNPPSYLRRTTNIMAGVCLGIGFMQLVTASVFIVVITIASGRTTDRLRRKYLSSVLHQDAEFFDRVGPGEVGTRMIKDIATVKAATGEKLGFMCWGFTTLLVALIMAFSRAARLAGVVFGVVPLAFILFIGVGYLSALADARLLEVDGHAGTLLEQILSSVRVVQSFAAETFLAKKYDQYLAQLQKLGKWRSIVRGLELSTANCILNLTYSVAFWYGSQLVVRDNLAVGLMFTIFWNMFNAIFAIATILPHISAIRDSVTISAHILADIERVPAIDVSNPDGKKLWDSHTGEKTRVKIELRNVTFAYPSRPDHKSLDDVSLVLEAGKVTALVGASGSGKSTIASLLLRYYDPTRTQDGENPLGRILVAGHDLESLNLSWIRSQIGVIAQDPQLFTATIFENVAFGLGGTPWELPTSTSAPNYAERLADAKIRVEEALKQAQAWDFVSKLPEGVETRVTAGRTGVLSGGQRQRIAAARAFVRKPRILLLDEGTSALDSETEQRMMAAIHEEQAKTGMTTILIAHRLSSIQNADRIVAMSNGRVAEQGTYNELMAMNGVFSTLVRHQTFATRSPSEESGSSNLIPKKQVAPMNSPQYAPATIELTRAISAMSGAKTVVDESMEKGLLVKDSKPSGIFGRFLKLLWAYKFWISIGCIGALCAGASFPIAGWLIGFVITSLSIQDDDARLLAGARYWAMWFLILAMVNIVTSFTAGFSCPAAEIASIGEIGFFDKEENAPGALTASVALSAGNVSVAVGLVWQQILISAANLLGGVILGLALSWKLALLGISPIPLIIVSAYYNIISMEKYENDVQKPLEEASAFASENIDAIKTVAALGRENTVMERFDIAASKNIARSILILSSIVMWWGVELYVTQRITLSHLYATFEAVVIAGFASSRLFTFVPDLARMMQGFRRICQWEDRKPEVASLESAKSMNALEKVDGEVAFRSCTLQYASRPRPAIDNLDLVIPAGQSVAFCGPSGGGKSSIISMISRFYDPNMGTISLDGRDIRSIPLDEYRSQISLVSQDAVLYEGTFRENITLGEDSISQERLERACRDATILDFIQSLPQGFDTPVGFKGSQMSGGQRQASHPRVCIARALLRDPKILLLDEATSALDAESERSVQQALEQASKGRTTISIAHRLSTIQGADMIHVIEDGRIVESGSHAQLLERNGRYVDSNLNYNVR